MPLPLFSLILFHALLYDWIVVIWLSIKRKKHLAISGMNFMLVKHRHKFVQIVYIADNFLSDWFFQKNCKYLQISFQRNLFKRNISYMFIAFIVNFILCLFRMENKMNTISGRMLSTPLWIVLVQNAFLVRFSILLISFCSLGAISI